MKKYEQLNLITLIAMIMIATIHFFNYFVNDITFAYSEIIIPLMRGFAIIAVPLFVVNMGYSNLISNKRVNFEKLVLYIVIPTLIFTWVNHILFGTVEVFFNLEEGFSGSWFGDMYVGIMLLMPLITFYYYNKKKLMLVFSFALWLFAYLFSVNVGSATLLDLGLLVCIPYIGMLVCFSFLIFECKKLNNYILVIILLVSILLEAIAYAGVLEINKFVITSYFSPVTFALTYSLFNLIYHSGLRIPNLRSLTQSSYFYYFTSYIMLRYFRFINIEFVIQYPIFTYFIVIVGAGILSYLSFKLYYKVLCILKLEW